MTDTPTAATAQRLQAALGPLYQVRGLLGRGGFAEVYEVFDASLDRRLAVKVLRPDLAWTAGTLARFQQEARAIARLQHPNVLPIFFVGDAGGLAYYAMPFVEGESLAQHLKTHGKLGVAAALRIVTPLLDALQHAHDAGLVHRDIKPENVMLEARNGRVLLVDFGIAKAMQGDAGLTQAGFVVGTPHYMAPEQALGQSDLDGRTDLYAVGAMLYQLLTGAPPFDGDSSQEIVGKHLAEPPPVARLAAEGVPASVSGVVARCLAKKRDDRFASAELAARALTEPGEAPDAAATTPLPRPQVAAPRRRRPLLWAGGGAALAIVGVAAFLLLRPPELAFANRLVVPVTLVGLADSAVVAPGATLRVPLTRGRSVVAAWRTAGTPARRVHGRITVDRPRGRVTVVAGARGDSLAWFAPHITNATGASLTLVLNAGLRGSLPCDCTVPPGAVRRFIGYYPLYANSTVEARDAEGRRATFRDLGPEVDPVSGVVNLRFGPGDLR